MGLPDEHRTLLHDTYAEYVEAYTRRRADREKVQRRLVGLLRAGRKAGWPLSHLAEPCGISPERVRQYLRGATRAASVDFPAFDGSPPPPMPEKKPRQHLSGTDKRRLRTLAPLAAQNKGREKSPAYAASVKFTALLRDLRAKGVSWDELSEGTRREDGSVTTVSALRARLGRQEVNA